MHEREGLQKEVVKGMIEELGGKLTGSRKMHFKEPEEDGLQAHHCTEVCE
jgi:hypothetical protein